MAIRLYVAISELIIFKFEQTLDERTAGAWRDLVSLIGLYPDKQDKEANDGWVEHYASQCEVEFVYAAHDLTSTRLSHLPKVLRLTRGELVEKTNQWLRSHRLGWRTNVEVARGVGTYRWCDIKSWVDQFTRMDPIRGRRVAAGLLLQLRIVKLNDLAKCFDLSDSADHNSYFVGSDPHSGDFGLVNILAALLPGSKLTDAQQMPPMNPTASIRVFSDAGWSGGESIRRLQCIYRRCHNKTFYIGAGNRLTLRFAFITDIAEQRLADEVRQLRSSGATNVDVQISYPVQNRLIVKGEHGEDGGLAFQNQYVKRHVDPSDEGAMRETCSAIGSKLSVWRPLGTRDVASTIGFEHSLPRAMLPVFIVEDKEVRDHPGKQFVWQALIRSKHLTAPAADKKEHYREDCPLSA